MVEGAPRASGSSSSFPVLPLLLFCSMLSLPHLSLAWRPWPHYFQNATGNSNGIPGAAALGLGESKKYEGSSEFVHLHYHMGPVLTANITVHIIWYGEWAASQKHILRSFLRSISPQRRQTAAAAAAAAAAEVGANSPTAPTPTASGALPTVSAWWRTAQMYTDQTGHNITAHIRLGAERSDRNCSHGRDLTRLSIQHVIRTAVAHPRRPLPVHPRGGLYLVLTAPDVTVQDFCSNACGFHYFTFPSIVGYTLPYAWAGNSAKYCPGVCAYPFASPPYAPPTFTPVSPPNGDVGVDGMVSVVAHELAEMASNPLANAWYAGEDPSFPTEIADLCEGIYGTGGGGSYTGQLTVDEKDGASYNLVGEGGRRFLVQWLWNPVLNYCSGPNALDQ